MMDMVMVDVNDFRLLNKQVEKYAKFYADNNGLTLPDNEIKIKQFGFYFYILEKVCDEVDSSVILDSIIDTEFNQMIFGFNQNDFGVDAVYIDDDKREVKLFNFKFREKFNPEKAQSLNDNFTSIKFFNFVINGTDSDFEQFNENYKNKLKKLNRILTCPDDEWSVEFFQVSNEAKEVIETNDELKSIAQSYAIKIKALALPTITEFMSIRPEEINAKCLIDKDAIMAYSEDVSTTSKSFIARMQCSEVLRITCDNQAYRESVSPIESDDLKNTYLDFGVLFDNVRGFVNQTKFNQNIANTLGQEPKKFFMYNNGITIVSKSISSKTLPGNKTVKIELNDFQVVNGGQTLRTIHEFNRKNDTNLEKYLDNAEVLVRMFVPDFELNEAHKIAEFTNSQNPIKSSDLKSLALEQIEIEKYLDAYDIAYMRKTGDTGKDSSKSYDYTIKMETLGQILKSLNGDPDKSTNSLKDIFGKDYDQLFKSIQISTLPDIIIKYFNVINEYKLKGCRGNQIKYFYIMYMDLITNNNTLSDLINVLESFISEYQPIQQMSVVRMMGTSDFKNKLKEKLAIC